MVQALGVAFCLAWLLCRDVSARRNSKSSIPAADPLPKILASTLDGKGFREERTSFNFTEGQRAFRNLGSSQDYKLTDTKFALKGGQAHAGSGFEPMNWQPQQGVLMPLGDYQTV